MPLEYVKHISRPMVRSQPDTLFVFGDNILRKGYGGQAAAMRGEPNSVGIPTKKAPSNQDAAFFTDGDFEAAKIEIDLAISRLKEHLKSGGLVVWPEDGIGTGLADLENRAPEIWEYLEECRLQIEVMAAQHDPRL